MITNTYDKGSVVCWEGDYEQCMYYIEDGSVGVYMNYAKRSETQVTTLWRGDYFGEMGLLEGMPRSATVVVLEPNTVLQHIDVTEFDEFFEQNPRKVHAIMMQLAHKLRNTTREYLELCQTLRDKVGDKAKVDESSALGLAEDERLMAVHDQVQAEDARRNA